MSNPQVRPIPLPELREHLNDALAKNPFLNGDVHTTRPEGHEDEAARRPEKDERRDGE